MSHDKIDVAVSIPEAVRPVGAPAVVGTSSLRCYFQKDGKMTWGWGVTNDNAWFSMSGEWTTTPITKLQKFFTTTKESDMKAAMENARAYYKLVGYDFVGFFAAASSSGSNYPIVADGVELFPKL